MEGLSPVIEMRSLASKLALAVACCSMVLLSVLPAVSAASRKEAVLDFSDACYDPLSFGYFNSPRPQPGAKTSLESTHSAVALQLALTGSVTTEGGYSQGANINTFINSIENDATGGYRDVTGGTETVENTYKALQTLDSLNSTVLARPLHLNFTLNSSAPAGGFGPRPAMNDTPDVFSTYYAVRVLTLNASLDLVNETAVHAFLESCKRADGYAGSPGGTVTSIAATAMAVALYRSVLVAQAVNVLTGPFKTSISQKITLALASTGGFADPAHELEASLFTSYHAVSIVKALDITLPGGDQALVSWILSLQNPDGGFSEGKAYESSSIIATLHAVQALLLLDPAGSVLNELAPWYLVQAGGVIAAIVIIGVIVAIVIGWWQYKKRDRI